MVDGKSPQVGLRGSVVRDPEQREAQRQQILLAAAKTFARKGYEAATMDDIAREMGLSKGILYYQFRSKQDLIVAARVEASGKALERLEEIAAGEGGPAERMAAALRDLVGDNFRELSRHVILIPTAIGLDEDRAEQIRGIERRYEQVLIELFEAGVASGDFVPGDPQLTVYTLIRAAESPSHWHRSGGRITPEAVVDGVTAMLLRSISRH
jgi:AcrR family transcriptional regulator